MGHLSPHWEDLTMRCVSTSVRRGLAVTLALAAAWWVSAAGAAQRAGADKDTGGIDPKVVAAWEKAGAEFGWMSVDENGLLYFVPERPKGVPAVPTFTAKKGESSLPLRELPAPGAPFGLKMFGLEPLTDADWKALAGFEHLHSLSIMFMGVTDARVKELAGLPKLQVLVLDHSQVSGTGVKELARLKQLQVLSLGATKVGDADLKELAGLKQLRVLGLDVNKIGDAGLKELAALSQLRVLGLSNTQVTDQGVAELKKALPKVQIQR
jgi:hypothetical protein